MLNTGILAVKALNGVHHLIDFACKEFLKVHLWPNCSVMAGVSRATGEELKSRQSRQTDFSYLLIKKELQAGAGRQVGTGTGR